ncbi:MAG: hypothetical protein K2N61_01460, partial [Lachnospiraceae bacterium]|nr:hypothetical protein [Lachnospiraceae bacterium]
HTEVCKTMEKEEIKKVLNRLIVNNSSEEISLELFEGKSIVEDLGFDSVSLMQLVMEIEETFGVSLDESGSLLELLDSYDELLEFLISEGGTHDE